MLHGSTGLKMDLTGLCLLVGLDFTGWYLVILGYWVRMGLTRFYGALLGYVKLYQVILGYTGLKKVGSTGLHGLHQVKLGFTELYRVTLSYSGLKWVWLGSTGLDQVIVG